MFATLRGYRAAWLGPDLLAGVMLAAIAVPEQLATAKLAGFPVEIGLAAFACGTLAVSALGTNPYLSAGADSTTAPIFAASIGALAAVGGPAYLGLAGWLAIGVGALLIALGALRAGWVADLLSVPVTNGVLAGIAVHIIAGQLPSFLGIAEPQAGPLLLRLAAIARSAAHTDPPTLALGAGVLAVMIASARVSERLPGALLGLCGAAAAVALFGLRGRGVAVVGALRAAHLALRPPALPPLAQLIAIVPLAVVVAAVCAVQTSLVDRAFRAAGGTDDDADRQFIGVGAGAVLAGLTGSFVVNASPPRTAMVRGAGGRSQLTGLLAVGAIAAAVTIFPQFTVDVPQAALAGVLIFIGVRLVRLREMRRIARYSERESQLVAAGALLVIALPIQTGMLLAIMLSLAHGVTLVMWPPATQLFQIRGSTIWWSTSGEHELVDVPGVVVFAPSAPVNFTNAEYVRRRLFALVDATATPVRLVVIEASGMSDVDYTGSQMLQAAIGTLRERGIDVALARLIGPHAQTAARRSGLIAKLGNDRVFLSVAEAIAGTAGGGSGNAGAAARTLGS